jgi:pimeloyl-ACP methyl ester carboxylesterase
MKLWHEQGGSGAPALVLLHGLGANADVWTSIRRFLAEWPGRWLAPDLRGHGRSAHQPPYSVGTFAADVAELLAQDEALDIVGHSMGGVVAMALATGWYGVRVRRVIAFGVKFHWVPDEITRLHALARTPVRWFETQPEAVERYLKVSGLYGLVDPSSPAALSGVREENARYRLAADPMINAAVGPAVAPLVAACRAPLRLAAGSKDPMVNAADMQPFDRHAVLFEGAGHNPHVEQPQQFWQFVRATLGVERSS